MQVLWRTISGRETLVDDALDAGFGFVLVTRGEVDLGALPEEDGCRRESDAGPG